MTKFISLMGVDGSGKTTLLHALEEKLTARGCDFLRIPQTYFNVSAPYRAESETFEELSQFADYTRDIAWKTVALFLPMSFSGWIQRELTSDGKCPALIYERQPIIDSLVYADFYTPMIQSALNESQMTSARTALGAKWSLFERGVAQFRKFFSTAQKNYPAALPRWSADFPLNDLPLLVRDIFALPMAEKVQFLITLYGYADAAVNLLPQHIYLLELDAQTLERRVAAKSAGGAEIHEQAELLERLQSQLIRRAQEFCEMPIARTANGNAPQFHLLGARGLSISELVEKVIHSSE